MENIKTIRYYLANAGKSFDVILEVLYFISLVFIAGILYGAELSLDAWIDKIHTKLDLFFLDVIGLLISYLFVAIVAPLVVSLFMEGVRRLRVWVLYIFRAKHARSTGFFRFSLAIHDKETIGTIAARRFAKLDDDSFAILKDCVLSRKISKYLMRIFSVLSTYLFIKLFFYPSTGLSFMDLVVIPLLVGIPLYYAYSKPAEDALSDPEVFSLVEDQKTILMLKSQLKLNPYLSDVLPEELNKSDFKRNLLLIRKNCSAPVLGCVVIVTTAVAKSWDRKDEIWKVLSKTYPLFLIDTKERMEEEQVKDHKSVKLLTGFSDLQREVNRCIFQR